MDNLCHTVVGGVLAESGLKRYTRYATPALLISANIPDVDVFAFLTDVSPIAFRRGWTHGPLAQLLLPIALTAAFRVAGTMRPKENAPPLRTGWLLLLCYVGVYSHVFLDWLNTYGIRLLAPFDWRWFYGDAVFIVDPWLWMLCGVGIWLSRRRGRAAPARAAMAIAACYILAMVVSARVARGAVIEAYREAHGIEPRAVMVGPRPVNPFAREVIVDAGDHYVAGDFTWLPTRITFAPERIAKNAQRPEVAAAIGSARPMRDFLVWSRFPYWTIEERPEGTRVSAMDMRFREAERAVGATFVARTVLER